MRVFILVMDSFGIGATPDADEFGDVGADTLGHIAEWCAEGRADTPRRQGPLHIPNLERLGVGLASQCVSGRVPKGLSADPDVMGRWAAAREMSRGKDTQSGHWEIAGVPVLSEWGTLPKKRIHFPLLFWKRLFGRLICRGGLGIATHRGQLLFLSWGKSI